MSIASETEFRILLHLLKSVVEARRGDVVQETKHYRWPHPTVAVPSSLAQHTAAESVTIGIDPTDSPPSSMVSGTMLPTPPPQPRVAKIDAKTSSQA